MSGTVCDSLLRRLADWDVRRVYGYPGDGINGLVGALDRAQHRIQFIQARHEELAALVPLPPHITFAQAKNFASSIWAGDAEALGFLKKTVKDAAEAYLPRKKP